MIGRRTVQTKLTSCYSTLQGLANAFPAFQAKATDFHEILWRHLLSALTRWIWFLPGVHSNKIQVQLEIFWNSSATILAINLHCNHFSWTLWFVPVIMTFQVFFFRGIKYKPCSRRPFPCTFFEPCEVCQPGFGLLFGLISQEWLVLPPAFNWLSELLLSQCNRPWLMKHAAYFKMNGDVIFWWISCRTCMNTRISADLVTLI